MEVARAISGGIWGSTSATVNETAPEGAGDWKGDWPETKLSGADMLSSLPKVRKRDAPKGEGEEGVPLGLIALSGGWGVGRVRSRETGAKVAATAPEPFGSFLLNMLRREKLMMSPVQILETESPWIAGNYINNHKSPVDLIRNFKYSLGLIQLISSKALKLKKSLVGGLSESGHEIGCKGFWTNCAECDSLFWGRLFGPSKSRSRDIPI